MQGAKTVCICLLTQNELIILETRVATLCIGTLPLRSKRKIAQGFKVYGSLSHLRAVYLILKYIFFHVHQGL
jgi:hypothetical protein